MDQVTGDGQASPHQLLHHQPPLPGAQQVLLASEINQESFREYALFRQSILTSTHPHHRGRSSSPENNEEHRRKKNNEAAKRSRDSRRAKEDEIAIRAAFLEQENLQLKWEAARLKTETARLRAALLLDSGSGQHSPHSSAPHEEAGRKYCGGAWKPAH